METNSSIPTDRDLLALAGRVAERLEQVGLMLVTAESCTGGWAAKLMTDLPGSSAWFERGFVTYTNASKQEMLGVPEHTLRDNGAVSEAVVRAMALGALAGSQAQVALSVSGVAGPGGGSADKPVGTVWFGWARSGARLGREDTEPEVFAEHKQFSGDRDAVRRQAVVYALEGVIKRCLDGR